MERTFRDTYAATSDAVNLERHVAAYFGERQQGAELADPGLLTLITEEGGDLAAFAQLRGAAAPPCVPVPTTAEVAAEVARFYVDRAWHGRGLAMPLMEACLAAAPSDVLWLLVYRVNRRAIAFYEKCGFVAVGTAPYQFGDEVHDDIVMARRR